MTTVQSLLSAVGLLSGLILIAGLTWSTFRPSKRVWPPDGDRGTIPIIAWGLTLAVFGAAIGLGIMDWGTLWTPVWLQWAVGPIMIVTGNLVAWWGAFSIGLKATSGLIGELVTTGPYHFSRHPQYVADMVILVGLGLLFSSLWVWPVVVVGVAAFALAPFAEEPWLYEQYGAEFDDYRAETRRFL